MVKWKLFVENKLVIEITISVVLKLFNNEEISFFILLRGVKKYIEIKVGNNSIISTEIVL